MMQRRTFLKSTSLAGAATVLYPSLVLSQDAPNFTMEELRKGAGTFSMRGGTIGWFIDGDNLVVIDSQFPEQAEVLLSELRKKAARKIDVFINTHHHGDHTSGNPVLIPASKESIAHENSKLWQKKAAEANGREASQVYPRTTFRKALNIELANETIAVRYHGRAHTSGDSVIHFEKANVAHVGDLVFNRHPPYIDRGAGASIANWMNVLEELHGTFDTDTRIIFGHGQDPWGVSGGREDLLVMRNYLDALLDFADKGLKAGKSIEELSSALEIPGFSNHSLDSRRGNSMLSGAIRTACEEIRSMD